MFQLLQFHSEWRPQVFVYTRPYRPGHVASASDLDASGLPYADLELAEERFLC